MARLGFRMQPIKRRMLSWRVDLRIDISFLKALTCFSEGFWTLRNLIATRPW